MSSGAGFPTKFSAMGGGTQGAGLSQIVGGIWYKKGRRDWCTGRNFQEDAHMGHQDQDGEKVGQMSLFDWKLEAATDREKQKFIHFQVLLSHLSWCSIKNLSFGFLPKARVRTVRPNLGVFFPNLLNSTFLSLYYSAHEKATAVVFIWGDRGYPAVRFEYKTASERYLVAEI